MDAQLGRGHREPENRGGGSAIATKIAGIDHLFAAPCEKLGGIDIGRPLRSRVQASIRAVRAIAFVRSTRPIARMWTLNDVANTADYLASDWGAFVSGQHLVLSGGAPAWGSRRSAIGGEQLGSIWVKCGSRREPFRLLGLSGHSGQSPLPRLRLSAALRR